MKARRRTAKHAPELPPLGSQVRIGTGGATRTVATVIEHRGPLGVGGREIVRVRYRFAGSADVVETEVPLDELTPILDPVARSSFTVRGHLVSPTEIVLDEPIGDFGAETVEVTIRAVQLGETGERLVDIVRARQPADASKSELDERLRAERDG